jgi:hypothetical protein
MDVKKLIIFDYSGTLSMESTVFARPDSLMKHLSESGLMNLGIESPDMFWGEIVNPTWLEGSTTSVGYKKVIEDRISAILYKNMSTLSCVTISDAASSFVDNYLNHSLIDDRWRPILRKVSGHPSVGVIIATDHYAEATGYIIRYLYEYQIQAVAAKDAFTNPGDTPVVVACSADLGVHKADHRFWEILKTGLNINDVREILLVDDFGYNEQKGDSYGTREKAERRKLDTEKSLQYVFPGVVHVVPFMIEGDRGDKDVDDMIMKTSEIIERYLNAADDV